MRLIPTTAAPARSQACRLLKRTLDGLGATAVLALCAPFLSVVIVLVALTSRGAPFCPEARLGTGGRQFRVYKIRTTGSGRWLRRFALDELPQLVNVIGGSMSLVGPRPSLPVEVQLYHAHLRSRLLVQPGMTGLWRVRGPNELSWGESVQLDLYYVRNWSLALDLVILAGTLWPGSALARRRSEVTPIGSPHRLALSS